MSLHIEVIADTQTHKIIKIKVQHDQNSKTTIQHAIDTLTKNHEPLTHTIYDCTDNPDHKLLIIYK